MKKIIMGKHVTREYVEEFLNAIFSKYGKDFKVRRTIMIARLPIDGDMTHVAFSIEGHIPVGAEVEVNES